MSLLTIPVVNANANPDACGSCRGKCCSQMPGSVLPTDLDPSLREDRIAHGLRLMLETGRYAIDWWEGSPFTDELKGGDNGYYLRPSIRGEEGQWVSPSWGGACTFHGPTGCALPEAERPGECKMLIPVAPGQCYYPEGWDGRRSVAQAWWPFRHLLAKLRMEN